MKIKRNFNLFAFFDYDDDDFKKAFEGKKILEIKMCTKINYQYDHMEEMSHHCPEGGLTFFLEDESGQKSCVILGYNDLGEWIEHEEIFF